jgi:uncharacterized protein (DUF488 family)
VIDTRIAPHSKVAGWSRGELQQVLPEYFWIREFGNENYQNPDVPFRLVNVELGIVYVSPWLESGRNIILLCYEANPALCHRRMVAEILSERFGLPIVHLMKHGSQIALF